MPENVSFNDFVIIQIQSQSNEWHASDLNEYIDRSRNLMREKLKTSYRHLYGPDADGGLEHQNVTKVGANGQCGLQTILSPDREIEQFGLDPAYLCSNLLASIALGAGPEIVLTAHFDRVPLNH